MRVLRDWAEEHWAEVGVTVFIVTALAISVVIAVGYNVFVTSVSRST